MVAVLLALANMMCRREVLGEDTSNVAKLLRPDQARIQKMEQAFVMYGALGSGSSYSLMIPYVTRENNRRTNVGLNNYSSRSMMKGNSPDANVTMTLFQEKGMMYGSLTLTGGTFPIPGTTMTFSGEMDPTTNGFMLLAHGTSPLFNLSLYMPSFSGMPMGGMQGQGMQMQGKMLYLDEQNRKDVGTFTMTRMGHVYQN
jgi:hypothetical protein